MFWEATPDSRWAFIADPTNGFCHHRGATQDLTLYALKSGEVMRMPSGYDEFTPRAAADCEGGTAEQRRLRDLLRNAMIAGGFLVYAEEWCTSTSRIGSGGRSETSHNLNCHEREEALSRDEFLLN